MHCWELTLKIQDYYKTATAKFDWNFANWDVTSSGLKAFPVFSLILYYTGFVKWLLRSNSPQDRQIYCMLMNNFWIKEWCSFNFSNSTKWTGDDILIPFAHLIQKQGLPANTTISIPSIIIKEDGLKAFCQAIASTWLPEGLKIDFSRSAIGDREMKHIAEMIKQTWVAKWLSFDFSECNITAKWLSYFSSALQETWFSEGMTLNFSYNQINRTWLKPLLKVIETRWLSPRVSMCFDWIWIGQDWLWPKDILAMTKYWGSFYPAVDFLSILKKVWLPEWFFLRLSTQWDSPKKTSLALLDFVESVAIAEHASIHVIHQDKIPDNIYQQIEEVLEKRWIPPVTIALQPFSF